VPCKSLSVGRENRANNLARPFVHGPRLSCNRLSPTSEKVSRLDIEAWHTTLRNGGLAARAIRHAHPVLGTRGARIFAQSSVFFNGLAARSPLTNGASRKHFAMRSAAVRRHRATSRADTAVIA